MKRFNTRKEQFKTVTVEFENRDETGLNIKASLLWIEPLDRITLCLRVICMNCCMPVAKRITNILIEEPSWKTFLCTIMKGKAGYFAYNTNMKAGLDMNIYWRELAINIKAMLIWFFILSGLGVLVIAFFPTVAKQAESFQQLMTGMPKGLLAAFGLEQISMTDIMGFYATKQYTTLTLFGSVYAIMLAAGILSKEENDRTIEFLLSKPVSRSAVIGAKLLSTITLVAVLNLLITIVMYISWKL